MGCYDCPLAKGRAVDKVVCGLKPQWGEFDPRIEGEMPVNCPLKPSEGGPAVIKLKEKF